VSKHDGIKKKTRDISLAFWSNKKGSVTAVREREAVLRALLD